MSDASSSSPLDSSGYLRISPSIATTTTPSVPRYRRAQRGDGGCRVRKFVGGLSPAGSARSLRRQPDGKVLVTDGPYTETKEHIGGFWVLEAADLDEALAWGRKAVIACRAPVEVRAFFRSNIVTG